jgi:hypothetical protein
MYYRWAETCKASKINYLMYATLNGDLIKIIINTSIMIDTNVNLIISNFCVLICTQSPFLRIVTFLAFRKRNFVM